MGGGGGVAGAAHVTHVVGSRRAPSLLCALEYPGGCQPSGWAYLGVSRASRMSWRMSLIPIFSRLGFLAGAYPRGWTLYPPQVRTPRRRDGGGDAAASATAAAAAVAAVTPLTERAF